MASWPSKDPDEKADYKIDWYGTEEKPGKAFEDVVNSSTWFVPDGITKFSDTFDDNTTTIWLIGGTAGETYLLTNRVTTDGGRIWDQTMRIRIRSK